MISSSSVGYFGPYGGRFVAETLVPALDELVQAMAGIMESESYRAELDSLLAHYVGRPTALTAKSESSSAR